MDEPGQQAVIEALKQAGVRIEAMPGAYESAWRAAGLRDGVESDEAEDYAPSPRSTRGATRA